MKDWAVSFIAAALLVGLAIWCAKAWAIAGWTLIGVLLSVLMALGLWVVDQMKNRN